jgi:hypothetical protein
MKSYLIIILICISSIGAFSQERGIEFSFNNSFFNARNSPFEIPCDDGGFCVTNTLFTPELEFKFNIDYTYRIKEKHILMLGAGLNIWAYERESTIITPPLTKPPVIEGEIEQNISPLFQINIGYKNNLITFDKYKVFAQAKVIGGLGNAFGSEYIHLGIQPAIGASRQINENHSLFFVINYTKYFSRPDGSVVLPNLESAGFIVGVSKSL